MRSRQWERGEPGGPGARGRAQSFQVRTRPPRGQRRGGPRAGVWPAARGLRKGRGGAEPRRPLALRRGASAQPGSAAPPPGSERTGWAPPRPREGASAQPGPCRVPARERAHIPGPAAPPRGSERITWASPRPHEGASAQTEPRRASARERAHSPRPRSCPRRSHASHVRPLGGRPRAGPAEPREQTSNCLMNIDAEARLLS